MLAMREAAVKKLKPLKMTFYLLAFIATICVIVASSP